MEPIEQIGIPNVTIPQVKQSDWIYGIPFIPNNDPPVTLQIGFPIVDMPGCVKMHRDNKDHISNLPFDKDLVIKMRKVQRHYARTVSIHHMMRWIINQKI